ncbi:MAG: PBP1A family penicillin-binding protein [Acidimicrobiia bacterium]|nr:PBP1A family penicillin-binding protein [Acidimicrobiia bacterium]
MKKALLAVALVVSACTIQQTDDPGIGEHALTTLVFAADGSVLAEWHAGEDRIMTTIDQIPQHMIDAVISIEDERFWTHAGVDMQAIIRAARVNTKVGSIVQGGSTITQQYIKNTLLTNEVTLERKVEEASLALKLESTLTKEEILERYLNTVYFGSGAYGISTAAASYFGKPVSQLTVSEASLLAGLIQAPSSIDPRNNPEGALARRELVLQKMVELDYVDYATAATANVQPLVLAPRPTDSLRTRYPYFVEELKRRLLDDERLGATPTDRYNTLFKGGLRIYTTIDPASQAMAEQAIANVVPEDGPDVALVAIEPGTGMVRALVGGRDFYDEDDPIAMFNLATQGQRQPGSAFKPFVLAAALESGIELDDIIAGGREVVIETDAKPWEVENYASLRFPDLPVLEATVFSVNVAYARLVDIVGPEKVTEIAARLGINGPLLPYHALALGAQEVSPIDMASAYSTFAAGGLHSEPIFFTGIETTDGDVVIDNAPPAKRVIDTWISDQVTTALTQVVERGTGVRANIGRPVAGKTGTSQDHKDAWFVGYTPQLSAAVWVGYAESPAPMEEPNTPFSITGGTWPAEIWANFAAGVLNGVSYGSLAGAQDLGLIPVAIDTVTGLLAGPACPREFVVTMYLPADAIPTETCTLQTLRSSDSNLRPGFVPAVVERPITDGVADLNALGYEVKVIWVDGEISGTIAEQDPPAETELLYGSTVVISVVGPEPGAEMPDVLAFTREAAVAELTVRGIPVRIVEETEDNPSDAKRRAGRVWSQTPAAGSVPQETAVIWVNPATVDGD